MKNKNRLLIVFAFLLLIIPINVLAYSKKVVLGGENVGIEINSGVTIVGFYKVNDRYLGLDAGLEVGDVIYSVGNTKIDSIDELSSEINKKVSNDEIKLTLIRKNKKINTTLNLIKTKNNVYKTGLYVKDKITGIGTITYIDPKSKIYGALGHEVLESTTGVRVDVKDGKIFKSDITGITKSNGENTGEKNASLDRSEIYGDITKNTDKGIYGTYEDTISDDNLIEVASLDEVKLGKASIYTVLDDNNKEKFDINIIEVNRDGSNKNILFEVIDEEIINRAGGVIRGMSGSPIVQDNKLIGAVTHAVVSRDDKKLGYGIGIISMLEEGEK